MGSRASRRARNLYLIYRTVFHQVGTFFTASENLVSHPVRAKYYRLPDGSLRLACVQAFNTPRFREEGWEKRQKRTDVPFVAGELSEWGEGEQENAEKGISGAVCDVERATRRARKNAFDMIMCNHDLDTFATFTYSPDAVGDKASYDECYKYLNTWLSNRVQRRGLKYVCVPERTKAGDIHFHAIMNSTALSLEAAYSPKTGRQLTHGGNPLYNIPDWKRGFTSAELIRQKGDGENEREAVSKYIFKYMGKQAGQKIGGRYCLIGGALVRPVFVYGDRAEEFLSGEVERYRNHVEIDGVVYDEWSFI